MSVGKPSLLCWDSFQAQPWGQTLLIPGDSGLTAAIPGSPLQQPPGPGSLWGLLTHGSIAVARQCHTGRRCPGLVPDALCIGAGPEHPVGLVPIQGRYHITLWVGYGAANPQAPLLPSLCLSGEPSLGESWGWAVPAPSWVGAGGGQTDSLQGAEAQEHGRGRTQRRNPAAAAVPGTPSPAHVCAWWGGGLGPGRHVGHARCSWAASWPRTSPGHPGPRHPPSLGRLPGAGQGRHLQPPPGSPWRSS